jgi:hypothetical protein
VYEWDPAKAKSNQEEHEVDFADAVQVFDNQYLNKEDTATVGDQVFVALGMDNLGRLLVMVYTYRKDKIKIDIRSESYQKRRNRICAKNTISVRLNSLFPPKTLKKRGLLSA